MTYDWKRYWCPMGKNYNSDEYGYTLDPEPTYGKSLNPDLVRLEDMKDVGCLILLGEPGIGKTYELEKFIKLSSLNAQNNSHSVLSFDLHNYPSDYTLEQEVFKNPCLERWLNDKSTLILFLDSMDEGSLTIAHLANYLGNRFSQYPIDRLRLRIVCRTMDWPPSFTSKLQEIWMIANVKMLELVPLRKGDIIEAANQELSDPKGFIDEIERKEVVPFARKPVTLRFLMSQYNSNGKLPGNKAELYHSGCLHLCEETNPSRVESKFIRNLSSKDRMKVAGRTAAIMMCANRVTVSTDINMYSNEERYVKKADLAGRVEILDGVLFPISEDFIIEVLSTGLFSARGENSIGFSHQTYAEFLAAWYIHENNTPITQIKSLISHPLDLEGKLIPQLSEMAAWLAGFREDVFDHIAKVEPEILLRGDVSKFNEEQRKVLVSALLNIYDRGKTLGNDWSIYEKLGDLFHPALSEQLLPYLDDLTRSPLARKFAIDLVERCNNPDLHEKLVNIALNANEPTSLRISAGWALAKIGDAEAKARLLPLANLNPIEDPEDEFKGIYLKANWPHNISSKKLFQLLTPPQNDSYYGSYVDFLSNLAVEIHTIDIVDALKWVENLNSLHGYSIFNKLIDKIIIAAWSFIDDSIVLDHFAIIVLRKLHDYEGILGRADSFGDPESKDFYTNLEREDLKRRSLIMKLLTLLTSEDDITPLVFSPTKIIFRKDFIWLLAIIKDLDNPTQKKYLATICQYIFDQNDQSHIEATYKLMQNEPILKEIMEPFFGPVILGSDLALQQKRNFRRQKDWEGQVGKTNVEIPRLSDKIDSLIKIGEEGDLDAWWKLNKIFNISPDGNNNAGEYEFNIKLLPGWLNSNDETKPKIINLARNYIYQFEPNDELWLLKENIFYRPINAGYRALHLLYQESKEEVASLPVLVWEKWASIILVYHFEYTSTGVDETSMALLKLAYKFAPEKINTILNYLVESAEWHINLSFLNRIETILNEQVLSRLIDVSISGTVRDDSLATLLNFLLRRASVEAEKVATHYIVDADRIREGSIDKALIAAQALINHLPDAGWNIIWKVMLDWLDFGKKLTLRLAEQWRGDLPLFHKLTSKQLADYYNWLVDSYPPSEDPNVVGGHSVTQREEVGYFRNSIPQFLARVGTKDAFDELKQIVAGFPEVQWLRSVLQEADLTLRRNTWHAPDPQVILCLLSSSENRQVENGEQLLDILCESLSRLEIELQAETPSAIFLWNEWPCIDGGPSSKKYRPKEENRLSDFIKLHLKRDIKDRGIVINREVEIRPTIGGTPGEEIDIRVDAIQKNIRTDNYSVITVIVEVKGCWNKSIKSAMKNQLVDRYLAENECQHGLFLVGWYYCHQWDDEDYQKKQCKYKDKAALQQYLSSQAIELSSANITVRSIVLNSSLP